MPLQAPIRDSSQSHAIPGMCSTGLYGVRVFDEAFPPSERLPRYMEVELITVTGDCSARTRIFTEGRQIGQDLTDNSRVEDGYRFHDAFHMSCAALLGWSPVLRKMLGVKRKSDPKTDEIEDGGRACVIEEGISALVFSYASAHCHMEGCSEVDATLLKNIKGMTAHLEVSVCTPPEWQYMILKAYEVWRNLERSGEGIMILDLDARQFSYKPRPANSLIYT